VSSSVWSPTAGRHAALRWPAQHTHRRLGGILRLSGVLPSPARKAAGDTDPKITVLIPAHNEHDALPAALASLRWQTRAPERVVVVADNCTDATVPTARALGADVVVTEGNSDKKAGALNQALATLLPRLGDDELVLVMDADSMIVPKFLAVATQRLADDARIGAVGGVFYGEPRGGLVGALQRNEYTRYAREIARHRDRAVVLTGTASLFRVPVLRAVAAARGSRLPGRPGTIYDTSALTEDNEITLAVKTLGWATVSPRSCGVLTEIMPTWSALWAQRLRWQRGAVENLRHYGLTWVTAPYLVKQAAMYLGIAAVALFLVATTVFGVLGWLALPHGLWWALPALFVTERVWTVRRAGWRAMALAAPLVVEFGYDLFQQAIYLRAAADSLLRRTPTWHHVGELSARHRAVRPRNGRDLGEHSAVWGPWPVPDTVPAPTTTLRSAHAA
jgi:poly-beta-1,6-N-acetyl-D-glucosamine synthase